VTVAGVSAFTGCCGTRPFFATRKIGTRTVLAESPRKGGHAWAATWSSPVQFPAGLTILATT